MAGTTGAVAGFGIVRAPARPAQFSWKYGSAFAKENPINVRAVEAFNRIRTETGGRLDIKAFPNSVLGNSDSMIAQLRIGAVEMTATSGNIIDTVVPISAVEGIAFAYPDSPTVFRAMDGDLGKIVREAFYAKGLVSMDRIFEAGFRHFTTSTIPIRNVEDLEGLKLRVSPGRLVFDTFRSLGASISTFASAELYTALRTRAVDAEENALSIIEGTRIYEVQKYCSLSHHQWTGLSMTFNREKWESLPGSFQEIARKHLNAAAIAERRDSAALDVSLRDKLARQGLTFNDDVNVASFKAKLVSAGYYSRWRNEFGPTVWGALEKYVGKLG